MQRRIQMVVEERRLSRAESRPPHDPEKTVEIPMQSLRAIGRVAVHGV